MTLNQWLIVFDHKLKISLTYGTSSRWNLELCSPIQIQIIQGHTYTNPEIRGRLRYADIQWSSCVYPPNAYPLVYINPDVYTPGVYTPGCIYDQMQLNIRSYGHAACITTLTTQSRWCLCLDNRTNHNVNGRKWSVDTIGPPSFVLITTEVLIDWYW